ncbi:MAG: hypothetical protein GX663_02480 [Clostridiales bacterium]|nr:hypothetical protein [Clostridiales bacterium]
MNAKFIALVSEYTVCNLLALVFVWRLAVPEDKSIIIFGATFIAITILITIQVYFIIMKPYGEKMAKMEKAAEESEKAEIIRREFVANVSHELKTPLTSISGFIETLQEGASEDPEIRTKFIDIIAIETARLKRLIEDLLVLSDIENKRDSDALEFDMKEAVQRTIDALTPIAERKNIKIISSFDEDINIRGSADRFRQMMMNLIENAIKYSDYDSSIWVKAANERGKIIVSVKDEGIGIAPEHHERLFERFYRVDKSRSKKVGGTGLGLSIVKHIAVLFGASLKVHSEVGKGTTFYIAFNKEG